MTIGAVEGRGERGHQQHHLAHMGAFHLKSGLRFLVAYLQSEPVQPHAPEIKHLSILHWKRRDVRDRKGKRGRERERERGVAVQICKRWRDREVQR